MIITVSQEEFKDIKNGKSFIVTQNFDYAVNDRIAIKCGKEKIVKKVRYIDKGEGVKDGYVILGLSYNRFKETLTHPIIDPDYIHVDFIPPTVCPPALEPVEPPSFTVSTTPRSFIHVGAAYNGR